MERELKLRMRVQALILENNRRLAKWRAEDKELSKLLDELFRDAYQIGRREKKA